MSEGYTLRNSVFRRFLENPDLGPTEMARLLGANYNSVKAVFSQLYEEGLLVREARGSYALNIPRILVHLMDRIEALERGLK